MDERKNWSITLMKLQTFSKSIKERFRGWSTAESCQGSAVCGPYASPLLGLKHLSMAIILTAQSQKCVIRKENVNA